MRSESVCMCYVQIFIEFEFVSLSHRDPIAAWQMLPTLPRPMRMCIAGIHTFAFFSVCLVISIVDRSVVEV